MIRIEIDRTEKGVGTVRNFVTAATDDCFALELLHPMAVRYYLLSLKLEMHMSHQIGWLGAMMMNCYLAAYYHKTKVNQTKVKSIAKAIVWANFWPE